jgi:phosphoribosyl 1,2-cyclic phosphodiesterase
MKLKFWGVRGSIPTPGYGTIKYGGNTSCVSIEGKNGEFVILDGGTGIRNLGNDIMKNKQFNLSNQSLVVNPLSISIFFSHVHWDHIQGIPFFKPLFIKQNNIHMYGEKKVKTSLENTLKGQQQYPNFPISLEEICINGAQIRFNDIYPTQSVFIANNKGINQNTTGFIGCGSSNELKGSIITVSSTKLSHPDGVLAYKITEFEDGKSKSIVYATDTEHHNILDPRLLKLAEDAEVLIYDSQYTPEEYAGENFNSPKIDWGHSTYEFAVDTAIEAKVKRLILFHHDPEHTDDDISRITCRARGRAYQKISWKDLYIDAAAEGDEINLDQQLVLSESEIEDNIKNYGKSKL